MHTEHVILITQRRLPVNIIHMHDRADNLLKEKWPDCGSNLVHAGTLPLSYPAGLVGGIINSNTFQLYYELTISSYQTKGQTLRYIVTIHTEPRHVLRFVWRYEGFKAMKRNQCWGSISMYMYSAPPTLARVLGILVLEYAELRGFFFC